MKALLAACLLASAGVVAAADGSRVTVFEEAELIIGPHESGMPAAGREWRKVSLPHNWWHDQPEPGYGWYRLRFNVEEPITSPWAVCITRRSARETVVYANHQLLTRWGSRSGNAASEYPLLVSIPPALLRPGENTVVVRIAADPRWFQGMTRITVGPIEQVARIADNRSTARALLVYMSTFGFALISVLALAIWRARRDDHTLFWFAVCGLSWSGLLAFVIATRYVDFGDHRTGLFFLARFGIAAPVAILCLRALGRRHPWLEGALWLALAGSVVAASQPYVLWGDLYSWLGIAWSLVVAIFLGLLIHGLRHRRLASVLPLCAALAAIVLADVHDFGRNFGWSDYDNLQIKYLGLAVLLVAIGIHLVDRHLGAIREVQRLNLELEGRVAQKAREIERQHARLLEVERDRTLRDERRRIMADMHDGLGSRLVALLSLLRQPRPEPGELEEEVNGALDELRIAVDSLAPVDGDIGVVLGNVRHRMRTVFDRAGVHLSWQVADALPQIEGLTPARVLAIQRLLLEVFTNIVKHSGARTVGVAALRNDGAVSIVIDDSGRGFDPAAAQGGHGLGNLRRRALEAGGTLDVASAPGRGTRVTLTLPVAPGAAAHTQPAPDVPYPIPGISRRRDAA